MVETLTTKFPLSEYQRKLQESNRSEIDLFLEYIIDMNNSKDAQMICSSSDFYKSFTTWKAQFSNDYKTTNIVFSRNLLLLKFVMGGNNYPNIIDKRRTNQGNCFVINNVFLREYYGLDNISNINMPSGLIPSLLSTPTPISMPTLPDYQGGGETMENFNRVTCPSSLSQPRDEPDEV